MIRHLISRSNQIVVLLALLLMLTTAVLVSTQPVQQAAAPTAIQVVDGWGDPTGG